MFQGEVIHGHETETLLTGRLLCSPAWRMLPGGLAGRLHKRVETRRVVVPGWSRLERQVEAQSMEKMLRYGYRGWIGSTTRLTADGWVVLFRGWSTSTGLRDGFTLLFAGSCKVGFRPSTRLALRDSALMRLATSFAGMRALERPGDSAAAVDEGSNSSMMITSFSASLLTRTEGIGQPREREESGGGALPDKRVDSAAGGSALSGNPVDVGGLALELRGASTSEAAAALEPSVGAEGAPRTLSEVEAARGDWWRALDAVEVGCGRCLGEPKAGDALLEDVDVDGWAMVRR
ncbi:hypothetical protein GN244_ATG13251 [Phytophthora infestans]|uniref:Uncharacterized protein n=1 Tax=Phytophthora infestans TaxID=4787 RepID=A0A833RWM4_PHYIN|nr:hypothetical protein GN244_ATG13251 [Phytophthora infestans]KAF4148757.1 hypothetical protein GN958_ATG02053 [Phytophthora infestans]